MNYPETEGVSFHMEKNLYDELFECEVEPYNIQMDDVTPAQIQFIQSMLDAEEVGRSQMYLVVTNDGLEHLLRVILPEIMEMWSVWSSRKGEDLLSSAKGLLGGFGLSCPY